MIRTVLTKANDDEAKRQSLFVIDREIWLRAINPITLAPHREEGHNEDRRSSDNMGSNKGDRIRTEGS